MERLIFQLGLLAVAISYAFWRGGRPEKMMAVILGGMAVIDLGYHLIIEPNSRWDRIDLWHFVIDLSAMIAMLWVALQANRFWPLFVAALQLITVIGHLARYLNVMMPELVYAILVQSLFNLLTGILLLGTLLRHRRRITQAVR